LFIAMSNYKSVSDLNNSSKVGFKQNI
jgi:hypothetical protein